MCAGNAPLSHSQMTEGGGGGYHKVYTPGYGGLIIQYKKEVIRPLGQVLTCTSNIVTGTCSDSPCGDGMVS